MEDILKVAIPAAIALIGTIVTVLIGYRQWKRQQEVSRYSTIFTEKQSAYKELWDKLESVHIKLRTEEVSLTEFNDLVREVNSYILRNGLYIEEKDRRLSSQYLKAVFKMKEVIAKSGDDEAETAMHLTDLGPDEVTAKEILSVMRAVDESRNLILERFRKVIGGKSPV